MGTTEKELLKLAQQVKPKSVEEIMLTAIEALYNDYTICDFNYDYDFNIQLIGINNQDTESTYKFISRRKILTPTDALIIYWQPALINDDNPYTFNYEWAAFAQNMGWNTQYSITDLIKWFGLDTIFWHSFILGIDDHKPENKDNAFFNQKAFKFGVKVRKRYIEPEIEIYNNQ